MELNPRSATAILPALPPLVLIAQNSPKPLPYSAPQVIDSRYLMMLELPLRDILGDTVTLR